MALTQIFPDFKLQCVPSESKPLPQFPELTPFCFRRGADLQYFSQLVNGSGYYCVDAAPGVGKSTKLPQSIVRDSSRLVIHVVPFPQLAASLARWHSSQPHFVKPTLIKTLDDELPQSGYVITHAAWIVARWLRCGINSLKGTILLQDESHESGAASAVMRSLSVCADLWSYVAMSATHSGGSFRALECLGSVYERLYEPSSFRDPWSVMEPGAPWAATRIESCILIIEDDTSKAQALMSAYNMSNVVAFRWTAKTPVENFLADLDMIDNSPARKYAIIADSTYRSGYTLPVESIIDSGKVRRVVDIGDGGFRQMSRDIYSFEMHQTKARGGRLAGLSTSYYRPAGELNASRCVMEQTDVEAYVLILRMMGYEAPREYAGARFARGKVPRDLCAALNNGVPLASMVDYLLIDVSQYDVDAPEATESQEDQAGLKIDNEPIAEQSEERFCFDDARGVLDAILEDSSALVEPAEIGKPLFDSEKYMLIDAASLKMLSESIRSVIARDLLDNMIKFVWSQEELEMNQSIAAMRYNFFLAKFLGVASALRSIRNTSKQKDVVALRQWAKSKGEVMTICQAEMLYWFDAAKKIASGNIDFFAGRAFDPGESKRFSDEVIASFDILPDKLEAIGPTRVLNNSHMLEDRFKSRLLELG